MKDFFASLPDGWTIYVWMIAAAGILIVAAFALRWALKNSQFDEDIKYVVFDENDKDKMEEVITDIDELHRNIYELNTLIDPQKNQDKHVDFNFNHVIQSAFDTVSSNIDKEVPFNKKLSAVPSIRASSTDLYQITASFIFRFTLYFQKNAII